MPNVDRLGTWQWKPQRPISAFRSSPFPNTPADLRSADGSEAFNADNLVCRATQAIKSAVPEIGILCDVALDPYTDHGHDGLMSGDEILNDETVDADTPDVIKSPRVAISSRPRT